MASDRSHKYDSPHSSLRRSWPLIASLIVSLMAPLIAQLILPNLASSPVISLHPLAVIGFVTFLVNALQLLPIGRLDGGRVATAVLGGGQASPVTCL